MPCPARSAGSSRSPELRSHLWFFWVAEGRRRKPAEVRCRRAEANFLLRNDLPYLAFSKAKRPSRRVNRSASHRLDDTAHRSGLLGALNRNWQRLRVECVNALTDWAALSELRAVRVRIGHRRKQPRLPRRRGAVRLPTQACIAPMRADRAGSCGTVWCMQAGARRRQRRIVASRDASFAVTLRIPLTRRA